METGLPAVRAVEFLRPWPRRSVTIGSIFTVGFMAIYPAVTASASSPFSPTLGLYIVVALTQAGLLILEVITGLQTSRRRDGTSIAILLLAVIITILVPALYTLALYGGQSAVSTTSQTLSIA